MKRGIAIAAFTLLGAPQAFALCQDGPPFACMINGKHGTRQCVSGHITACMVDDSPPGGGSASGTVAPKYFVLTIIYAPPGTKGGHSSSSVSYGSGSTAGTTTTGSQSFKQSYGVSVSAGGGFLASATIGASFAYTHSSTDSQSLEIKKATTTTLKSDGPGQDGVDHDHDVIYLWMNPRIAMTVTSNSAAWNFSGAGPADIQLVYVGWLKDPTQMPPGVLQALGRNGITAADFPGILQRDPFATGSRAMPAPRFISLNTTFPYEPPLTASDSVSTLTFAVTSSTTNTTGTTASDDYKVGLTIQADTSFLGLAKASFKNEDSWDWTNTSSKSNSAGSTESASLTVGGPSFGYTGSTDMEVFYDRVYKTFVFRPIESVTPLGVKGKLLAASGQPIAGREVIATANGKTFRTFTNAQGDYRVFGTISGPVQIRSGTMLQNVAQLQAGRDVVLRATQ